jgi:hypothetical protein
MKIKRRFTIDVLTANGKTVGVVTAQPTGVRPSTFAVKVLDPEVFNLDRESKFIHHLKGR